eukprot:6280490-Alexandrium_andersonii.AAC.1
MCGCKCRCRCRCGSGRSASVDTPLGPRTLALPQVDKGRARSSSAGSAPSFKRPACATGEAMRVEGGPG